MSTTPSDRLHVTPTRVAEFFRFGCERQLRYDLVPVSRRDGSVPRPGYDAERGVWIAPRAGAGLLAAAGRRWERVKLRQLLRRVGEEAVLVAGWKPSGDARRLPGERVLEALRAPGPVQVLVQPELHLPDPAAFAARYGIDPDRVEFGAAVPDLIRIRHLPGGRRRFQVVDIKHSAAARSSHLVQVAYYALVLEEICRAHGIDGGRADRRWGRVWSRAGRGPERFELAAYLHQVEEILRRDLPRVTRQAPEQSAWHLSARCAGCTYLEHCRHQADAADDLARVVGITPLAKQVLQARGIRSVRELAGSFRKDTYHGCHALESQAERLRQRAQAVRYGKVFDVESRTHLMPPREDVRVVLSAEGDPVSGRVFALGMRVESTFSLEHAPPLGIWVAEAGTAPAERAILDGLLDALERLLLALDARNARSAAGGASLHVYVYDRLELDLLRDLVLRHMERAGERPAIGRLLRFLSPRDLAAQPGTLRSAPGTVVADVVAALFALPVPYAYDLASVSDRLRPARRDWGYRPRADYSGPMSNQVAFERVHNVWNARPHGEGERAQAPEQVLEEIRATVASKLAAVDSVIRAVRERSERRERLQMRKEPFSLGPDAAELSHPVLETLRVFTEMESAAEAVATRALHVLPAVERARRHECIREMHLVERRADGTLAFEFDPACRDAKFRAGDFNLLLTNDDDRSLLDAGRQPWKRRALGVELVAYELADRAPRVVVAPSSGLARAEERGWIDLDRVCVLDRAPADFSTPRVQRTLRALSEGHGEADAILTLLEGRAPAGWAPGFGPPEPAEDEVLRPTAARYGRPVLNEDQLLAWRAAFQRPLSVIWGPPGTGKTYLLAWMLIGLAAAARRQGRPCRVLVTAATHRAVANVLAKLGDELAASGLPLPLRLAKLRGSGSEADAELEGSGVEVVPDTRLGALLEEAAGPDAAPLVVGSTVWSLWKQMRAAAPGEGDERVPVQRWFDVVIVDEASQMKVPDALIALSGMRPGAHLVFCGDDRQLAPVLRGDYGAQPDPLFGSVFSHLAGRYPRLALRESRRMNRALVAYPRELFYPGLVSMVPRRGLARAEPEGLAEEDRALAEAFLDPEDAVVLCTYSGVSATARNPFEARLAARVAGLARELLRDPATGGRLSPRALAEEGLAILAPHRAQNSAVLAELRALGWEPEHLPVVDTVERMQGNERDLILVSYGVADREYAQAEADFLLDPNRFNVAITRARAKLVVLVSQAVLDAVPSDERVLSGSMAVKGYRSHCRDAHRELEVAGPGGEPVRLQLHYRRL